jgi:uncharacterized repeat protein (TIGR04042 family)
MPAVHFYLRWPDGQEEQCYSPSTVLQQYFQPGDTMTLAEFVRRADQALGQASERVASKYGYYCSSAADQLAVIQRRAASYPDQQGSIEITAIRELGAS